MAVYTITSDLGKENYLTAIVKGCIYEKNTNANIVEISSEIEPFDIHQTAYLFNSAYNYFPNGSHHFILSGLYNTANSSLLITQINGHYIYFLDNGFASLCLPTDAKIFAIKLDSEFQYHVGNIAKAFSLASFYIDKGTKITEFATPYQLKFTPQKFDIVVNENEIIAQVLFIDRFKNVVINLTKIEFEEIKGTKNFEIQFVGNEKIKVISNGYNDVETGRKLCFFNNAGFLEIAVRGGKASDLFGFETGDKIDAIYKTIKIFFE